MHKSRILTITMLTAVFVVGCSRHPSQPSSNLPVGAKDLGALQLTEDTPQYFSLGDRKGCTVIGKLLPGGVSVTVEVLATNTDGSVKRSEGQITTPAGQRCAIEIDGTTVALTPSLKKL